MRLLYFQSDHLQLQTPNNYFIKKYRTKLRRNSKDIIMEPEDKQVEAERDVDNEVIKYEPVSAERIEQAVQEVHCQTGLSSRDIQPTEEIISVKEDELQELMISKYREFDALSLNHFLRNEAELLAKAKAREQVTACSLQSHLQELQENQGELEKRLSTLQRFKEQLQHELKVEFTNYSQIEKQVNTTGKIVDMLQENYETLEKARETTTQDTKKLEQDHKDDVQNYEINRQKYRETKEMENKILQNSRDSFERELLIYNNAQKKADCELIILRETKAKVGCAIMNMKKECDDLKSQYTKNDKILTELISQKKSLNSSINSIDLEKLEAQAAKEKQAHEETINALKNDLTMATERLNATNQQESALAKSLENEIITTNRLKIIEAKLEDEYVQFESSHLALTKSNEEIDTEASVICNSLNSKLQLVNADLRNLNSAINYALQNKTEKINNLNIIRQNNKEQEIKLADLKCNIENTKKKCESQKRELEELQKNITTTEADAERMSSLLLETKEKNLRINEVHHSQMKDLDEKLSCSKKEFEGTTQEHDSKINAVRDELEAYKNQTENIYSENQKRNEEKLQDLKKQLSEVKHDLMKKKKNLQQLKTAVDQKKVTRDKLKQDQEIHCQFVQIGSQEFLQKREYTKPSSVLKSPGKSPTASKKVSWRIPSNSTIETNPSPVYENDQPPKLKTSDELFEEMLRISRPERLEDRKRSRFD